MSFLVRGEGERRLTRVSWMGLLLPVRGESRLLSDCIAPDGEWGGEWREAAAGGRADGEEGFINPCWAACRRESDGALRSLVEIQIPGGNIGRRNAASRISRWAAALVAEFATDKCPATLAELCLAAFSQRSGSNRCSLHRDGMAYIKVPTLVVARVDPVPARDCHWVILKLPNLGRGQQRAARAGMGPRSVKIRACVREPVSSACKS